MKIPPPKTLNIPPEWKIHWNHFVDLPPDNDYPLDDVFFYFDEDLLWAEYKGLFIDLGFYGNYLDQRNGHFTLLAFQGDFHQGICFEHFRSRNIDEIARRLNACFHTLMRHPPAASDGLAYPIGDKHMFELPFISYCQTFQAA